MGIEIERKFLVASDDWRPAVRETRLLVQGYLFADSARQIRVRTAGDSAFLTVKGPRAGTVRAEFEYEIPSADAREMLALCGGRLVEKHRHLLASEGTCEWVVDEYAGLHAGLVVAEVEWQGTPEATPPLPDWIGADVTGRPEFSNAHLAVLGAGPPAQGGAAQLR